MTLCYIKGYINKKDVEIICYIDDITSMNFEADGIVKIFLSDESEPYEDIDNVELRAGSFEIYFRDNIRRIVKINVGDQLIWSHSGEINEERNTWGK